MRKIYTGSISNQPDYLEPYFTTTYPLLSFDEVRNELADKGIPINIITPYVRYFTHDLNGIKNYIHTNIELYETNGERIIEDEVIIKHINLRIASEMRFDDYLIRYVSIEGLTELLKFIPLKDGTTVQDNSSESLSLAIYFNSFNQFDNHIQTTNFIIEQIIFKCPTVRTDILNEIRIEEEAKQKAAD